MQTRISIVAALLPVLLLSSAPRLSAAPVSSATSGKKSIFVAEEAGLLDVNGNITPLVGTIQKGKKKTVLAIEAQITVFDDASGSVPALYQQMNVNGSALVHPFSAPGPEAGCGTSGQCTLTATYWLDIDAAEAANPGTIVNQPLIITLLGGNIAVAGAGDGYRASVSATVQKK